MTDFVDRSLIRRQDGIERQSRPQVHLITHSVGADRSRHKINVPAGVFISPAHAWISLELSGVVRVGLDDFAQRLLGPIDGLALPVAGQRIEKGAPLFSIIKGSRRLSVPSPVNGVVASVNSALDGHMEYVHMQPYELGWICTVDPANLPGDLQSLVIGANAVAWYRNEIDKYSTTLHQLSGGVTARESAEEERKRLDDASWRAFEQLFLHS